MPSKIAYMISIHSTWSGSSNNWVTAWQNQQNGMCAQRRLGSAWATASESSLCAQWVTKNLRLFHVDNEYSDQTGQMSTLIGVLTGCIGHFVAFVVHTLICVILFRSSSESYPSQIRWRGTQPGTHCRGTGNNGCIKVTGRNTRNCEWATLNLRIKFVWPSWRGEFPISWQKFLQPAG